jgi:predicted AAA+ superfamily ATPase
MGNIFLNRAIEERIFSELQREDSKIIVVYGARQVGKTTLVQSILDRTDKKVLKINGDRLGDYRDISSRDFTKLEQLVDGFDVLFVDEAQRIPEIGINLKILYDHFKGDLKIIVTGSSSLDLASSIKEPLTGRKKQFTLYPLSILELQKQYSNYEVLKRLEERMIFGGYPQSFQIINKQEKIDYISELTKDYLYKDILELEDIKYHSKLRDLLTLLAYQIGSEVSFLELGAKLGMGKDTVARYVDLLEQSFVLYTLGGFSRNLRKEVNRKPKIYFYDLGVRNAVIGNFNSLDVRNDVGALWENFLVMERVKRNSYIRHYCNNYFWRTYTGAELDYIEEYDGELHGYEFKYNKTAKAPKTWIETYKQEKASFECINQDNWLGFVLGEEKG